MKEKMEFLGGCIAVIAAFYAVPFLFFGWMAFGRWCMWLFSVRL